MSDTIIQVENLSKQYIIQHQNQKSYNTLRDVLANSTHSFLKNIHNRKFNVHSSQKEEFWALKDVSFEIKQGDRIGIIGRNGAGKSTLLKILSRITEPTSGRISIKGRVASLLEVGTGFHPELTGRENIYLNGAILGMSKAEITRKFDEIVDFAEVEKFLDTPVKHYSSGMYVRLAFGVAAHLEPEILIVDEVLAVGDALFQKKCLGKMEAIAGEEGRTIIFVSHNAHAIRSLCNRCILLSSGKITANDETVKTLEIYDRQSQKLIHSPIRKLEFNAETEVVNPTKRRGSGQLRFTKIQVQNIDGQETFSFKMGEGIRFLLDFQCFFPVGAIILIIGLRTSKTFDFVTSTQHSIHIEKMLVGSTTSVVVEFPDATLRPGEYLLYFLLRNAIVNEPYDVVDNIVSPLNIYTDKSCGELDFDPNEPIGYFNISSKLLINVPLS